MVRSIVAFHPGGDGAFVAELSCWHTQHIRHRPPFQERAWVLEPAGRAERIGSPIDCPLCDRGELPEGLTLLRTAGPWDEATLPRGLLGTHRTPDGQWGRLRVLDGSVDFQLVPDDDGPPGACLHLDSGSERPIPPQVPHRVILVGPVHVELELWGRAP